jgi:predicted nucleic acid-binding protein
MRVYWDSSALLNALAAQAVLDRLNQGEHVTRSHAYVEAFHHLSGRGLPLRDGRRLAVTPADAARMIRNLARRIPARDCDQEQTLQALDMAQRRGVRGRMVHDWMHARAAKLASADVVLTRDEPLSRLCTAEGLAAEWP